MAPAMGAAPTRTHLLLLLAPSLLIAMRAPPTVASSASDTINRSDSAPEPSSSPSDPHAKLASGATDYDHRQPPLETLAAPNSDEHFAASARLSDIKSELVTERTRELRAEVKDQLEVALVERQLRSDAVLAEVRKEMELLKADMIREKEQWLTNFAWIIKEVE
eukprot:SAG31_NODE_16879_length_692_cov_0.588533_1_plen_163_part_01